MPRPGPARVELGPTRRVKSTEDVDVDVDVPCPLTLCEVHMLRSGD
jgi:hypothetical protein